MENNKISKLNNMSTIELKEIIDNSFLYDTEIVDKAKELYREKNSEDIPKYNYKMDKGPNFKNRTREIITRVFVLILVALVIFGIFWTANTKTIDKLEAGVIARQYVEMNINPYAIDGVVYERESEDNFLIDVLCSEDEFAGFVVSCMVNKKSGKVIKALETTAGWEVDAEFREEFIN